MGLCSIISISKTIVVEKLLSPAFSYRYVHNLDFGASLQCSNPNYLLIFIELSLEIPTTRSICSYVATLCIFVESNNRPDRAFVHFLLQETATPNLLRGLLTNKLAALLQSGHVFWY